MSLNFALAELAQISPSKWLERHARLASTPPPNAALSVTRSCSVGVKTSLGIKQLRASFPCKCMKRRAEVERRNKGAAGGGGRKRELAMGGNGWEPEFCVSVCARLLPRKTRPERRWDLISAWRHGRKLVPLEGEAGVVVVVLSGGGWATLNVFPEKRERDVERENNRPLHSPAGYGGCCFFVWVALFNPYGAPLPPLLPVTLSQPSTSGVSP